MAALYQNGAFLRELVDAFLRGGKAFHHVIDEGSQADAGCILLFLRCAADFLTEIANQFFAETRNPD